MAFPAFLDTCVLYGAVLNDALLRLADEGVFSPRWSRDVLRELRDVLVREAGLSEQAAAKRIGQMAVAFPEAEVTGYASLVGSMENDPKDRHVLAAAVRSRAEVLVTFNLKHFPEEALAPFDLQAVHPDGFLLDQLDLNPEGVRAALRGQLSSYKDPAMTPAVLLDSLARCGVPEFARCVGELGLDAS